MIDINYIVVEQAKILAKKNPNAPVSPQRLRQITDHLKETVGQWCADHKVLLFSKGALWGGELPDYTQEILTVLELPRSDA
ncbi:hypothetical protein [Candidatus Odyssella thessalonicensis]|uniref:hypothetical protein n=1 Tax=Candidatus Odyssella thessalonicensis TaxID=84647 RepID=UPI0011125F19|nr:hypothetical protein [Candidatus Odyssella thessalonicensis]